MLFALAMGLVFLGLSCPARAIEIPGAVEPALQSLPTLLPKLPASIGSDADVDAFAASFFTTMVLSHDPTIVFGTEKTGKGASKKLRRIINDTLTDEGLKDAPKVAKTASQAVASEKTFCLCVYFEKTAYDVAKFLRTFGVLNCSNPIALALEYFKFVDDEFEGLDGKKVESYMNAVVKGLIKFVRAHGFQLEDVAQPLANLFLKEYSTGSQNVCIASGPSEFLKWSNALKTLLL